MTHWVPLSMGFPRQEHWSGLPFPSPEWVAIPFPGGSSWPRGWSRVSHCVSCIAGRFFTVGALYLLYCMSVYAQSCLTLWDPMDSSPPGSSVYGIFQARILEWVAISFSKGSFWPRDRIHISWVSCTGWQIPLPLSHLGSPVNTVSVAQEVYWDH